MKTFKTLLLLLACLLWPAFAGAGAGDPVVEDKAITGNLMFNTGATVGEFSTTLADNDTTVPTGQAVVEYVDLVNVKSDGATGDAVTDDTTNINIAIAAANSSKQTLFFPEGHYLVMPGKLTEITTSVYGPNAVIQAYSAITGSHTGAANQATVMTDSTASYITNNLVGSTIRNLTDGCSGVIISNNGTTVTVSALTGGTDNDWDNGDLYEIDTYIFYTNPGNSGFVTIRAILGPNAASVTIATPTPSNTDDYHCHGLRTTKIGGATFKIGIISYCKRAVWIDGATWAWWNSSSIFNIGTLMWNRYGIYMEVKEYTGTCDNVAPSTTVMLDNEATFPVLNGYGPGTGDFFHGMRIYNWSEAAANHGIQTNTSTTTTAISALSNSKTWKSGDVYLKLSAVKFSWFQAMVYPHGQPNDGISALKIKQINVDIGN